MAFGIGNLLGKTAIPKTGVMGYDVTQNRSTFFEIMFRDKECVGTGNTFIYISCDDFIFPYDGQNAFRIISEL